MVGDVGGLEVCGLRYATSFGWTGLDSGLWTLNVTPLHMHRLCSVCPVCSVQCAVSVLK